MLTMQMAISSRTSYLPLLRRWVEACRHVAGQKRFPLSASHAVSLALIEAVDNAIFHACSPIVISLTLQSDAIIVDVRDGGRGIKRFPKTPPSPLAISGRGLFLIRELMTEVTSRRFRYGHRLRMVYQL